MTSRNLFILIILSILVFISGLYLYVPRDKYADIFLFYDYYEKHGLPGRSLDFIVYELSILITIFTIFFLWYITAIHKSLKRVILPFLIISLLDIIDYIGWYQQNSIYKIPVLMFLILIFNLNSKK